MYHRLIPTRARTGRLSLITLSAAVMMSWTAPAEAQRRQGQRPPRELRSVRRVLGGVEMTAADSAVKAIVAVTSQVASATVGWPSRGFTRGN